MLIASAILAKRSVSQGMVTIGEVVFLRPHCERLAPKSRTARVEHSLFCKNSRTYDVVIDGVSTVSNYKAQFKQMIRDDSYACLMEKMKRRNLRSV